MRYLYGDSVPFPPQYDMLAALRVFVEQAAIAARADAEGRVASEAAQSEEVTRMRATESLESAHAAVTYAITAATTGGHPLIADYARRVTEFAAAIVGAAHQDAANEAHRARETAKQKVDHAKVLSRQCLETILIALRLPVSESRTLMDLEDGKNEFQTALVHQEGISASFALSVDALEEWQKPRRILDFAQGITLPVGVKRSLFKRTVSYEPITLDDFYIGGFDLDDDAAELRLRRKPDQKDSLVFKLRHTDAGLVAEVEHPGESGAESLDPVLDPSATVELERFVTQLRSACGRVVSHKSRLLDVALHGRGVFEEGLVRELLSVMVKIVSPTVAQISRRSGSPVELTLKTEDDDGRRQEVYVKKSELYAKLDPVPDSLFDPLRSALEARPETPPPPSVR